MMPIMFAVPWEGLFVVVAAVVVALFVCSGRAARKVSEWGRFR